MKTCAPTMSLVIWSVPMGAATTGSGAGSGSLGAEARRAGLGEADGVRSADGSGAGVAAGGVTLRGATGTGAEAAAGFAAGGLRPPTDHTIPAATTISNPKTTVNARRDMAVKSIQISGRR